MLWKLLDYIRLPNQANVFSLLMAQEWYMKHGKTFSSAVDKAKERKHQAPAKVNASGQRQAKSKR